MSLRVSLIYRRSSGALAGTKKEFYSNNIFGRLKDYPASPIIGLNFPVPSNPLALHLSIYSRPIKGLIHTNVT